MRPVLIMLSRRFCVVLTALIVMSSPVMAQLNSEGAITAKSAPVAALDGLSKKSKNIKPLALDYGVYAGGIHALDASLKLDDNKDTYSILLNAKPYGVIGNLLPWGGIYDVKGHRAGEKFVPNSFNKISQWREDNDSDVFTFDVNGVLVSQTETDETKKPVIKKEIPLVAELHRNTTDILTGMGGFLHHLDTGNDCNYVTEIYDGRRRYKLQFTDKGQETMTANQYNSFNGPARICEIEMIPVAGFSKKPKGYYKIQEEARARGQLPRVWVGHSWGYGGQDGPYVPVKVLVKSEYGAVLIHLKSVTRPTPTP